MPERAVFSPTAVTDSKASAADNCPRDDGSSWTLCHCLGLARHHRLVNIGGTLNDCPICSNAASGPDKNNVTEV